MQRSRDFGASPRQSLSLVVVGIGEQSCERWHGMLSGVFEVIEVGPHAYSGLAEAATRGPIAHRFLCNNRSPARRLNIGISLASGDWIVAIFGDEPLAAGWAHRLSELLSASAACVHLIRSISGPCLPLIAVRRAAFAYGAVDERFSAQRLTLIHWLHCVFGNKHHHSAPCEAVAESYCDWLGAGMPCVDHPISGLIALWDRLTVDERIALLEQALSARGVIRADLDSLLARVRSDAAHENGSPYRANESYDPRRFWESNTIDYVKWEAYQPDEPEIVRVVEQIAPVRVLELGCGVGRNARYFASARAYSGIEISMNLLARAVERLPPNSANLVCGDITRLCFASGSFDLVFSDSTVQHVATEHIDACVAEIVRVSARHICLIEFTEETDANAAWFDQVHMFRHDYARLFAPYCRIVLREQTGFNVQPAKKEVLLFEKMVA